MTHQYMLCVDRGLNVRITVGKRYLVKLDRPNDYDILVFNDHGEWVHYGRHHFRHDDQVMTADELAGML